MVEEEVIDEDSMYAHLDDEKHLQPAAWIRVRANASDADLVSNYRFQLIENEEGWSPLVRISDLLEDIERAKLAAQERPESAIELLEGQLKAIKEGFGAETKGDSS